MQLTKLKDILQFYLEKNMDKPRNINNTTLLKVTKITTLVAPIIKIQDL